MTDTGGVQKHVLVVEGEQALANIFELKLKEHNIISTIASNGTAALLYIERKTYDLILLDLLLPHVDGFEVLKTMREKKINAPIVVLNILSQENDIRRAKELGVQEYFAKSTSSLADIVEVVKKYLSVPLK